ncbi:MAG TPA: OmpA family protein [Bacteroidales bacterium]|jgi:chemotaxis protein MotB|nr:OmpA family protein [Bacteroidales bacterium]HOS71568.1 OmpA family protein [Bacteroidales bacterium]HQH24587.1 OmpA family protein [Bacteroidales bacterium]HQJ82515.1 OmpA family protein [Bacteroidales bacterium]
MRKISYAALPVLIAMLAASCAPVYRCGEPRPAKTPLTWSKNLRDVVRERDIVCAELELKEAENAGLTSSLAEMTKMHNEVRNQYNDQLAANRELQEKYNTLIDNSLSRTEQLNQALMAKSAELDRKERLLSEREETLREMQKIIARQDSITKRLNSILHNALLGFNPDELSLEIKNGKVYVSMSDKLLFRSGSAAVESKGREALKVLADVLGKNTDIDILVEGHTDNVPIKTAVYKDNWDLSVARATSIVRILSEDYRIEPTRLTASGKGEFFPKADNATAEGRARNRRTEIVLSPKLEEIMQLLTN